MLRIDVDTLINRPVQDVWDFFIDFRNTPRWTRSGSEIRQTSDGPLGVGTTVESVRRVFGRDIKSQSLVATQFEPGRLISYSGVVALIGPIRGGYTFESVGGATRLSRWSEVDLGRANRLLGPLLVRAVRGGQRTEMANLKRLIEGRA